MRSTQSLSITLPLDMAAMVKAKVASGDYASESEVIREGLRSLQARDAAVEEWLRRDVAATYDAHVSDPGRPGRGAAGPDLRVRDAGTGA